MAILDDSSQFDPNKILPLKYPWAREYYKIGVANNWVPEEIPMQDDIEQWKNHECITASERKLILTNIGFFSTAESLTANNIVLAIYQHVTNPECRQYLLRQAYEEAVHTDTFIYCCDSLALDPNQVYTAYQTDRFIKDKDDFVVNATKVLSDPSFKPDSTENKQLFVKDLIAYYVIMEGIFFYAGFAMMLALKRNNKMVGIGEQFEFIMRDESIHLAFGCDLINTIIKENPDIWTVSFKDTVVNMIKEATVLEKKYAQNTCAQDLLNINPDTFCQYVEYITDRRLNRLNLNSEYHTKNPFLWMSNVSDLNKEKNFFETKVTEYQHGSNLEW